MNKSALLLGAALVASSLCAQQIVVPDLQGFASTGTSTGVFGVQGRRIQAAYDSTLFTGCGVTGPITINRLRFRQTDGRRSVGGFTWPGVTVEVGLCAVNYAAIGTSFATNRGTMGPLGTTTVTVGSASGSVPNDYNIDIDLTATVPPSSFVYDPTLGVDLLIDMTIPDTVSDVPGSIGAGTASGTPTTTVQTAAGHTVPAFFAGWFLRYTSGVNAGLSRSVTAVSVGVSVTTSAFPVAASAGDTFVVERVDMDTNYACSSVSAHLGRRLVQVLPTGAAANSDFAPACLIDFTGPGGYSSVAGASVESYGAGRGDAASFYEARGAFPFDLAGTSLTLTPDSVASPTLYTVTAGAIPVDLTVVSGTANITDDGTVTHAMGWTFAFPGGSTSSIVACTNGYVHLAATAPGGDFSPTVLEFLGNTATTPYPAMIAAFWHDFHAGRNLVAFPLSGMYVNTDTSGGPGMAVTYVTWREVGEFATLGGAAATSLPTGISVNTFQVAIFEATGVIQIRYGGFTGCRWGSGITGFSRGRVGGVNAVDPGSRDLSIEVPFSTAAEGTQAAMLHGVNTRPFLSRTATPVALALTGSNHLAGTAFSAFLFDFFDTRPGINFAPLAAGNILSLTGNPFTLQVLVAPTGTVTLTPALALPLATNPMWMGVPFNTQYVTLESDGSVRMSNALKHTMGL
jgi:hypothetical protein